MSKYDPKFLCGGVVTDCLERFGLHLLPFRISLHYTPVGDAG